MNHRKPALLAAVLLLAGITFSHALISFGYLSPKQAAEHNLEIEYRAAGPDNVFVKISFSTEGRWKHFAEPNPLHYIELHIDGKGDHHQLSTTLRESRSTKDRVSVHLTVERSQLHGVSIWLTRRLADVADVVRLKEYIALEDIGKDYQYSPARTVTDPAPSAAAARKDPPPAAPASPADVD